MPYIHEGPALYLAADQETVVEEGDPRAAFLLAATGSPVPDDIARKHGLLDEKGRPAPANKLRAGMVENKAQIQPRMLAPGEQLHEGELPLDSQVTVAEVEFTPAPAFEAAVQEEEKPKRKKG